jgi:hypothetical protein
MPRPRLVLVASLAGALAASALPSTAGAQTSGARRALNQAVAGLGGRSSLVRLRTFRLQSTGRSSIFDEGLNPTDEVTPASTYTQTLNMEFGASARLRIDAVRTSQGAARNISEVIVGRLGYLSGVDSNGGRPATVAMTSDRWAAVRREQRLLNPQLLLREAVARPSIASTFPARTLNGRLHRVLVLRDAVNPIRLYVDARTGRIDRLTTEDHQFFRRDVRLVVDYANWRAVRSGSTSVRFPRSVSITVDGQTILDETRTALAIDRPPSAARFRAAPA